MSYQAAVMFVAGLGIPVLASLNAALGARIGSPAMAACALFLVALIAAASVAAVSGPKPVHLLLSAPKHLFLAGLFVAFYILSITWIAPRMGVGNAIFFVLLGQLVGALIIDHFGLLGAKAFPLDPWRAFGFVLMAAGVWATQKPGF